MVRLNDTQVDKIVESCLKAFKILPKTGKPLEKEWTVLSCVVQLDISSGEHEVVSVGSGSKCVGASRMCGNGEVLNDSHAEVCARRALLLHFYHQLNAATQHQPSIFNKQNHTFHLKDNIEFIFYSSQLPCGDASIIPKGVDEENIGDLLKSAKHPPEHDICDTVIKKVKKEDDIHRTGAKCLADAKQDLKASGVEYHVLGQVRTKPGRGDRTLSVSCSDKMARWIHVGVQGALLDMLCGPIFIKHFIFGAGVTYSEESLNRALLRRDCDYKAEIHPEFYQSSIAFAYIRTDMNMRPAPGSIVWTKTMLSSEVAVQGRKLGLTKKTAVLPKNYLSISKYKLFEKFWTILHCNSEMKMCILKEEIIGSIPYNNMKQKSVKYLERWIEVREKFFKIWTVKPDIWSFCVQLESANK